MEILAWYSFSTPPGVLKTYPHGHFLIGAFPETIFTSKPLLIMPNLCRKTESWAYGRDSKRASDQFRSQVFGWNFGRKNWWGGKRKVTPAGLFVSDGLPSRIYLFHQMVRVIRILGRGLRIEICINKAEPFLTLPVPFDNWIRILSRGTFIMVQFGPTVFRIVLKSFLLFF